MNEGVHLQRKYSWDEQMRPTDGGWGHGDMCGKGEEYAHNHVSLPKKDKRTGSGPVFLPKAYLLLRAI